MIVVVAIGNRAADHQKQDLRQGMGHPPGIARIFDRREMVQQRPQAHVSPNADAAKLMPILTNQPDSENHA